MAYPEDITLGEIHRSQIRMEKLLSELVTKEYFEATIADDRRRIKQLEDVSKKVFAAIGSSFLGLVIVALTLIVQTGT